MNNIPRETQVSLMHSIFGPNIDPAVNLKTDSVYGVNGLNYNTIPTGDIVSEFQSRCAEEPVRYYLVKAEGHKIVVGIAESHWCNEYPEFAVVLKISVDDGEATDADEVFEVWRKKAGPANE